MHRAAYLQLLGRGREKNRTEEPDRTNKKRNILGLHTSRINDHLFLTLKITRTSSVKWEKCNVLMSWMKTNINKWKKKINNLHIPVSERGTAL